MAKPALVLRTAKGSGITNLEMDTNLGNLANAVITLTAGGTLTSLDLNSGFTIANTATVTATLAGNTVSFATAAIDLSSPGNIGNVTPSTGTFTTLTTTGNINVGGNYLINGIFQNVREKVFELGTVSGTVTVNADNGSIQTMTMTANTTINTNNLTNFTAGETVSVKITQDTNTNIRIFTSNIRFANGTKTLSTANASIDSVHITYDGTDYLAVLVKGYV